MVSNRPYTLFSYEAHQNLDEPRLSQRTILRSISALALDLRGCSIYSTAHIGVSISTRLHQLRNVSALEPGNTGNEVGCHSISLRRIS